MNIKALVSGEVQYHLWRDDSDSHLSSSEPFADTRSTRTERLTRYHVYIACLGRPQSDDGLGDVELTRMADSVELDDVGVMPAQEEEFVVTRIAG